MYKFFHWYDEFQRPCTAITKTKSSRVREGVHFNALGNEIYSDNSDEEAVVGAVGGVGDKSVSDQDSSDSGEEVSLHSNEGGQRKLKLLPVRNN